MILNAIISTKNSRNGNKRSSKNMQIKDPLIDETPPFPRTKCGVFYLKGSDLIYKCQDYGGKFVEGKLNMNKCLGLVRGSFSPIRKNFSQSAVDCVVLKSKLVFEFSCMIPSPKFKHYHKTQEIGVNKVVKLDDDGRVKCKEISIGG